MIDREDGHRPIRGERRVKRVLSMLILLSLHSGPVPLAATNVLNSEDILSMRTIQRFVLSPDGLRIVFEVSEPSDEGRSKEPANTELWIVSSDGTDRHQLTFDPGLDSSPAWSPEGDFIAFLSLRRGISGPQIFSIGKNGGEPHQLTNHETPISSFVWSPDGKRIAFLATEPPSDLVKERNRKGEDEIVLDSFDTDDNAPLQRLWVLDLDKGITHLVPTGEVHVTSVSWSPDGSTFLLTVTDDANLDYEWTRSRLVVVPVSGGKPVLYCSTRGKLVRPEWTPDGKGISFLGASANGSEQAPSNLFVCREVGGIPQNLTAGRRFTIQNYRWLPNSSSAVLTIVERTSRYLATFDLRSREIKRLSDASVVVSTELSLSRDGRNVACSLETPSKPPDLWTGLLGQTLHQVTHLNPRLEKLRYGEAQEVLWKARDGWEITGVLVKPLGYEKSKRYPMIVQVHGGPESADLNGFQIAWAQLFAANGYLTFLPNYRGSIGRGVEYTIANHGDRGGKDFFDILDGIESMVSQGFADPDRLAIGGWSYGGFMSAWAITQTNMFKASVVGVGITDWFSLMGMAPVPMWNAEAHFLAWPYDKPEEYWRFSPVLQVKKAKTPTLMLWGESDPFVPPAQGREFFRGLRYYGVPSELVIYPREGHGLRERLHRKNAYARVLEWYGRYLKSNGN